MKKARKKKIKVAFWLLFFLAMAGLFFAPHTRVSAPPVIVKVRPQTPQTFSVLPFEEQRLLGPSVTVPVTPEPSMPSPGPQARMAIVIDDMGADFKGSERAVLLPPTVTLAFLPYAARTRERAREARERGHEILLHMPMEPLGRENPGKGALIVGLPMDELRERLDEALASFTGFDGVNNHMGSKFTAYEDGMAMVAESLKERQLFFLDSRTSPQTVAQKVARQRGVPAIARDVFLDDDPSYEAVLRQLDEAARIARRKGYAVAIGHPHMATIEAIHAWMASASEKGIEVVPLRELVN